MNTTTTFKEFDDIRGFFLEEVTRENNVSIIELISVNDEKHKHFYSKLVFYEATNFVMMGKFLE